jgi:hypothetical protein
VSDYRDAWQQVRREILARHRDELRDCDRIRDYAVGMFENWTGRGIESTADALVASIFARSIGTFTCAVRNVRLGYGAQAAMLNRSLFEDMVDAHWIVSDPATASARYEDHHEHSRMLLADAVATFPNWYPDVDLPKFDPAERDRLDKQFGNFGQRPWSGLSLHERVQLIKDQWTTDEGQEGLRFMHSLAHRENNQTLHVSAFSLGSTVEFNEHGRPAFHVGPRPEMVHRAMFGSYWTFSQTSTLVIDHFQFPMTSSERAAMFSIENFHRPAER